MLHLCQFLKNKFSPLTIIVALPPILLKILKKIILTTHKKSNKTQSQIVTAFFSSVYKSIVNYVLGKDDKRVAIYWTAESLNQKYRKFGLIRNKLESDKEIKLDNIITNYHITSE